jgi:hypothetical protein
MPDVTAACQGIECGVAAMRGIGGHYCAGRNAAANPDSRSSVTARTRR